MNFKKLTINDIETVRPFFAYSRSNNCDNTVGGSVMWADYFDTKYIIDNDNILFNVNFPTFGESFTAPIGKNPTFFLDLIYNYCKEKNMPLQFVAITDEDIEFLESKFIIEKTFLPDWSDYLYNASDLINFSGRKYHGQKNHINFFKKTFIDYEFEEINNSNIKDIELFLDEFNYNQNKNSDFYNEEINKTKEVLNNNDKYKFFGLVLKYQNKIIAFSMGEIIKDTLFVHIEKANKNYRGAYPLIVNEFAKKYANNLLFINREENAGDKGLEISKLQYKPLKIVNKYHVVVLGRK